MTEQTNNTKTRIYKIGATRVTEDTSMANLSNEEVRAILQRTYPEIANATIRETTLDDGTLLVEWLPVAGRKG